MVTAVAIIGIVCNLISIAFVWSFNQSYDETGQPAGSDEPDHKGLSTRAAVLTTIAPFGMTVGVLFWILNAKYGKSLLNCKGEDDSACLHFFVWLLVKFGILWYCVSCGIIQFIAAFLMTLSTEENKKVNAGENVIAFGGFTAAWGYLTAIFSLLYGIAAAKTITYLVKREDDRT